MRWVFTDPRGVDGALLDPKPTDEEYRDRFTSPTDSYIEHIDVPSTSSKNARLSIYAEAYFARIVESLQADYSRLLHVLGNDDFEIIAARYLKVHPSTSFTIGEAGRHLPGFLEKATSLQSHELLYEVAKFDWQMIETFYAHDSHPLQPQDLATLTEQDWEKVGFKLDPSVKLLSSKWPLMDFWNLEEQNFDGSPLADWATLNPSENEKHYMFYRLHGTVHFCELPAIEYEALRSIQSGRSLNDTLSEIEERYVHGENADELSAQIMAFFGSWIQRGLLGQINL
jgi:hypothetical protein